MGMTIGIVVLSHGTYARHLVRAAELIAGKQKLLLTGGLEPHMGLPDFAQLVEQCCQKLHPKSDGILVLVDLQGGTPFNAANLLLRKFNARLVCGVNMPMLLEVLMCRGTQSLEELAAAAVKAGKEGVREYSLHPSLARQEHDGNAPG
jgi:mannose/fructose/sorbose-specific phosphotransferase system IIA component